MEKYSLGIDLGAQSIKFCQTKMTDQENIVIDKVYKTSITYEYWDNKKLLSDKIKEIIKIENFKPDLVSVNIPKYAAIIKNTSFPIKTLEEACIFAASYSKAWKQFAEAQAYWVLPEQVSKTAQSGEFVPKGAFIIRGKRNYYRIKLELAVGLIKIEDSFKVMCGPISTVKKHAEKYVIINPGGIKKNIIAHKIARAFNTDVDSVDRVLPPGGCTITETIGVKL